MRIAIALAVALMAASHVSHAQAGERPEIADRIYEYIMEQVPPRRIAPGRFAGSRA